MNEIVGKCMGNFQTWYAVMKFDSSTLNWDVYFSTSMIKW